MQQSAEMGSLMVLSSSGSQELTQIGKFTPLVADALIEQNDASIDQIMRQVAGTTIAGDDHDMHPSIACMGELTRDMDESHQPNQSAFMVANYLYEGISSVQTLTEARQLEGALAGRGYECSLAPNLNAGGMRSHFRGGLEQAGAGDHVVLHYAGHGEERFMLGVHHRYNAERGRRDERAVDRLSYTRVYDDAEAAVERGAHVRMIVTACMSGEAVAILQANVLSGLESRATSLEARELLTAANALDGTRWDMLGIQDASLREYEKLLDAKRFLRAAQRNGHPNYTPDRIELGLKKADELLSTLEDRFEQKLQAFWKAHRPELVAAAKMAAMRTATAPVQIPVDIGSQRLPSRVDDRKTLGSILDAFDDVINALLAAAAAEPNPAG